jgi:crotonobetaine/carnitine-CoA ligase
MRRDTRARSPLSCPARRRALGKETPSVVASQHVDGRSLTYSQLHDSALRWANAFARLGIATGDHVATMLPIGFDSQLAMLSLGWLRAIDVPINVGYRGKLLRYVLDHADVTTLVIADEYLDRVVDIADDLPDLHTVIVIDGAARPIGSRRVVDRHEFPRRSDTCARPARPRVSRHRVALVHLGHHRASKAVIVPWALVYQFWSFVPEDTVEPGDGLFLRSRYFTTRVDRDSTTR